MNDARETIVIMGAAGRDFHNFNMVYRDDAACRVVAFTAAQIPGIDERTYPPELAGDLYPDGIPILPEAELEGICRRDDVDIVVFAYSDVTHEHVMHVAARVAACGCSFALLSPDQTMLASRRPVIAVSAVRTGCGKSQTSRYLAGNLAAAGVRVAAIRHPMPYGDLAKQAVQCFDRLEDLEAGECTLEEREEYEPYIEAGHSVYAGVDYARILAAAESSAQVILWDGGNNDMPFIRPDLHIVLVDALRPGHETRYWPGEVNLRTADIVVIAKTDSVRADDVAALSETIATVNPGALIVPAASPVILDDPSAATGKRVLVIEDGPTLTHGGAATGAGYVAAQAGGAAEIIDPRPHAAPEIRAVFEAFPHIGPVLPAMGYSARQRRALADTIEACGADVVVAGTPIDIAGDLGLSSSVVRARYNYADAGGVRLWDQVSRWLTNQRLGS
jgi:predicted GTPase